MLTSPAPDDLERDDRPAYRPFRATVSRVTVLSPTFTRVTFTGAELDLFGRDRLDQRIKLFFPLPGVGISDFGVDDTDAHLAGEWYARWLALPDDVRNPLRTYTVGDVRPGERELDVDFAVHPTPGSAHGPAGDWLAHAAPGDEIVIVGPDARSTTSASGIDWHPGAARTVLLAGDETAVPAIAGILRSLDAGTHATVLLEVPDAGDERPLETGAAATVRWLVRDRAERGRRLHEALTSWLAEHPDVVAEAANPAPQPLDDVDVDAELLWETGEGDADGGFYAWLAGEAAVIKRLRRLLVSESGVDRKRVAFMGYWREGRAEQN